MSPGVLPVWLPMASPMAAGGAGCCGRPLAVRLDPSSRSPLSPTVPSNSAQQNGATGGGDKDEQTVVDSHGGGADDLLMQHRKQLTGQYAGPDYFTLD